MKTLFLLLLTALFGFAPTALAEECNLANLYGTASASNEASAYPASQAIDNDLTTFWNMGADPSQYLQVDLNMAYEVYEFEVSVQHGSSFSETVNVSYSNDGVAWNSIYDSSNTLDDAGLHSYSFEVVSARFWRYTVVSGPSQSGVYEFSIIGICDDEELPDTGITDDTGDTGTTTDLGYWYLDTDGDGYGSEAIPATDGDIPEGYVTEGGDCSDSDATTYPGATEICGDEIDHDCDGNVPEKVWDSVGELYEWNEDCETGLVEETVEWGDKLIPNCSGCSTSTNPSLLGVLVGLFGLIGLRRRV